MTKYYLVMKQAGEGCDYMIGCACKVVELKAQDEWAVSSEVKQIFEDHGLLSGDNAERSLEDAYVVQGKGIDMMQHYRAWNEVVDEDNSQEYQRQLADLNRKFGR